MWCTARACLRKVERNKADIEVLDGAKEHVLDERLGRIGSGELDQTRVSELESGKERTIS